MKWLCFKIQQHRERESKAEGEVRIQHGHASQSVNNWHHWFQNPQSTRSMRIIFPGFLKSRVVCARPWSDLWIPYASPFIYGTSFKSHYMSDVETISPSFSEVTIWSLMQAFAFSRPLVDLAGSASDPPSDSELHPWTGGACPSLSSPGPSNLLCNVSPRRTGGSWSWWDRQPRHSPLSVSISTWTANHAGNTWDRAGPTCTTAGTYCSPLLPMCSVAWLSVPASTTIYPASK